MLILFLGVDISMVTLIVNWGANKFGIHVRNKGKVTQTSSPFRRIKPWVEGAPWPSSNLTILLYVEDDCFLVKAPFFSLER